MKKTIAAVCAVLIGYSAIALPNIYAEPAATTERAVVAEAPAVTATDIIIPIEEGNSTTDDNNANMESALVKVKQRMEIPTKLTEFSFNSGSNNGVQSYTFDWSNIEGSETLTVTVTGEMITYYGYHLSSETEPVPSFGKYSIDQLKTAAEKKITKLNPSFAKKLRLELQNAYLSDEGVSFRAIRVENGIDVPANYVNVSMNKNTGELIRMNVVWWSNASFKSPADKITLTAAQKAFVSLYSLEPEYVISYDYDTEKYTAALIYVPADRSSIDAFTGKTSSIYEDRSKSELTSSYDSGVVEEAAAADTVSMANPTSGANRAVSFTKAELDALKKNESLLTKEEALAKVKADEFIKCTSDYMLERSSLNITKETPSGYSWSLSLTVNTKDVQKYINVTLDAESGRITSFNKSSYDKNDSGNNKKTYKIADADKLCAAAYKHFMGNLSDNYRPTDDEDYAVPLIDGEKVTVISNSKTYRYYRYENNIPCKNDTVTITINNKGEVSGFRYQYTDVPFPSAERISVDKAFAELFTQQPLELCYEGFSDKVGKTKTYLSYTCDVFRLDAKTGKLCSYDGVPIPDDENPADVRYSDISGNYAEKYIYKLAQYGVTLESKDGKFNPSAAITEEEFRSLTNSVTANGYVYARYDLAQNAEKEYAQSVSRSEAAKIFVTAIGGREFAELGGIYKSEFSDVPEDSEYVGYIAIASAKNIMSGDANGKFNPNVKITRARAMEIAYLYLVNASAA